MYKWLETKIKLDYKSTPGKKYHGDVNRINNHKKPNNFRLK